MKKKLVFQRAAAVLFALAVWQTAALLLDQRILMVSPVDVVVRLAGIWREDGFLRTLWFTFSRISGGFAAALVIGVALAVLAGRFRLLEIFLWPFMLTIKTVPVASFIIIALIWLSSAGLASFIAFLMVLPIIYTNVLGGIKSVDVRMTEMASVFRIPWNRRLLYVWLPQIKPFLLSACGVALGLSWKAGVAAEIIGIPSGSIGEALYNAKVYLNTTDLFAWTVMIVLVSVAFEKLVMALLRAAFGRLERI